MCFHNDASNTAMLPMARNPCKERVTRKCDLARRTEKEVNAGCFAVMRDVHEGECDSPLLFLVVCKLQFSHFHQRIKHAAAVHGLFELSAH